MADDPQVAPEIQSVRDTLVPLPMDQATLQEWWTRIEAATAQIKLREDAWDTLLKEYTPTVNAQGVAEDVKVNAHFRNIHTKMGQLFVRSPEVRLTPKGPALEQQSIPGPTVPGPNGQPLPGPPQIVNAEDAIAVRQANINLQMGADHIDGVALMGECLFDMQGYSGIACVELGYRSVTRQVLRPDPSVPPPPPELASVMPPPPMVPVPVPVFEEWYAERFSAKKLLLDEQLRSSRVQQQARWIGRVFFLSKRVAKRQFGLTTEEMGTGVDRDDRVYEPSREAGTAQPKDLVKGYRIWYKAPEFLDTEDHPQKQIELVLFDCCKDRVVVHRPSQHQTFDDTGALTEDSLDVFPIQIGSLRDFPDTPFADSDSAFTNSQAKQLNTARQQAVRMRDANIGKFLYDTGALDESDVEKIKNGVVGDLIGVKEGLLAQGADKVFAPLQQVHATQDDWRTMQMLKADMDETLGISAVQAGANPDTVRSATEINQVGANAAGRQKAEQARVIAFYLGIVRAIDILLYRYATGTRYLQIDGPTGAKKLAMWSKALGTGRFSYDIKPDSQLDIDAARDRQQMVGAYNVMGKDPLVNRAPMLREVARTFGFDASQVVKDQQQVMLEQQAQGMGMPVGQPQAGPPMNKHEVEKSGGTPNAPQSQGAGRQERNPSPQHPLGPPA